MLKLRTFVPVAVGSAALVLGIAACSGGNTNGPGRGLDQQRQAHHRVRRLHQ